MKWAQLFVVFILVSGLALVNISAAQNNAKIELPDEFPDRPFIFYKSQSNLAIDGDLYFVRDKNSAPIPLTHGLDVDPRFSWSPDGRWLFFRAGEGNQVTENSGTWGLLGNYVYDFVEGKTYHIETIFPNITRRRNGERDSYDTGFSAGFWLDAENLILPIDTGNRASDFYILNMATTEYKRVPLVDLTPPANDGYYSYYIKHLSDTSWLLYAFYREDVKNNGLLSIYSWNSVTETYTLLWRDLQSNGRPMVSHNGQKLVYHYLEDGLPRMAIINTSGIGVPQTILALSAEQTAAMLNDSGTNLAVHLLSTPSWSPDDSQLAFVLGRKVWIVNADGTNLRELDVFPHVINEVYWITNDLLNVRMPPTINGYQLLRTDGTPLGLIRWQGSSVGIIQMLPTTADESLLQNIQTQTPELLGLNEMVLSPSPTPITCPGAPLTRIHVGSRAIVTYAASGENRENLRVRSTPNGEVIGLMEEGTQFNIIGGPQCLDGFMWWQIKTLDDTLTGWSAEGLAPDDYFIAPRQEDS